MNGNAPSGAGARLAVDIGGTFTDLVLETPARSWSAKLLTTRMLPSRTTFAQVSESRRRKAI